MEDKIILNLGHLLTALGIFLGLLTTIIKLLYNYIIKDITKQFENMEKKQTAMQCDWEKKMYETKKVNDKLADEQREIKENYLSRFETVNLKITEHKELMITGFNEIKLMIRDVSHDIRQNRHATEGISEQLKEHIKMHHE